MSSRRPLLAMWERSTLLTNGCTGTGSIRTLALLCRSPIYRKLSSKEGKLEKQRMLRALLANRFSLTVHREMRDLPVFGLEGHSETGDNDHVEMPSANQAVNLAKGM